jgi:hypothetical protein
MQIIQRYALPDVQKSLLEEYGALPDGWEALGAIANADPDPEAARAMAQETERVVKAHFLNRPALVVQRKAQLLDFYRAHNPSMLIQVDALLTKHRFSEVTASLLAQYGAVPEGWQEQSRIERLAERDSSSKRAKAEAEEEQRERVALLAARALRRQVTAL